MHILYTVEASDQGHLDGDWMRSVLREHIPEIEITSIDDLATTPHIRELPLNYDAFLLASTMLKDEEAIKHANGLLKQKALYADEISIGESEIIYDPISKKILGDPRELKKARSIYNRLGVAVDGYLDHGAGDKVIMLLKDMGIYGNTPITLISSKDKKIEPDISNSLFVVDYPYSPKDISRKLLRS